MPHEESPGGRDSLARLVAAVDECVERFTSTRDGDAVLAEEALGRARRLEAAADAADLAEGDFRLTADYTLGLFFHYRVIAAEPRAGGPSSLEDVAAALSRFATVYQLAPDLLPDGLFEVCATMTPPRAEFVAAWNSRATVLIARGRVTGDLDIVDDAVGLLRLVVEHADAVPSLADPGGATADPDRRAGYLTNLGLALRTRGRRSGLLGDIDEAVRVGRLAVETAVTETARRSFRSNLGVSYTARFAFSGEPSDLDQAVETLRTTATTTTTTTDGPAAGANEVGRMSNLAAALGSRFLIGGDQRDMTEAIELLAEAAVLAPDPASQAECLSNQAAALLSRYTDSGDGADLELAVDVAREAVRIAGDDPANGHVMRNNLALALRSRHQRDPSRADLDEAVDLLRDAAGDPAAVPVERAGHLSNLASALRVRASSHPLAGAPEPARRDLDEAVDASRQAISLVSADGPAAARYQSNLCAALSRRADLCADTGADATGPDQASNRDAAVEAGQTAARLVRPDDPGRAAILANAALALLRRDGPGDRERAAAVYRDAAGTTSAPPLVRAISAHQSGGILAELGQTDAAVDAFEQAIALLHAVTDIRLSSRDQGRHLLELANLGSAAAAAALSGPEALSGPGALRALDLLERGRGVLLAQLLNSRDELTALAASHPDLAAAVVRTGRELDRGASPDQPWTSARAARRARLLTERARLLTRIRAEPGFRRFQLPPEEEQDLTRCPVDGPVAVLNLAAHRCDALLVTPAGVRSVELPRLTHAEATRQANILLATADEGGPDAEKALEGVLEWMWTTFVADVLDELGLPAPPPPGADPDAGPPRVWWIPTGPLAVLPLHCAGPRPTETGDDPPAALDRAVSSYAPTLRTLAHARGRDNRSGLGERGLVVAVPTAPGYRPLPGADREGTTVRDLTDAATLLDGPHAGRDRVLAGLATADWAHFACHATTDATDPFDSHLVLVDGRLTVREITALPGRTATFAFLSACTTAFGGTGLVDEAIHVSSAFQIAGYPHVVGTLWEIRDRAGRQAAGWTYPEIAGRGPAQAVHAATVRLRSRYRRQPSRWAAHVHLGP
ncbi:CHAT domain-containing protein [Parafrankia elaeagni]|uniref:CHAT domain-containing protein n=1 Tax=Parafrankia elaeagni TaxID=222534 RepID=UPI00036CD4C3|nr:CHAT domain-containing protein [Parafrankia elaeagni]